MVQQKLETESLNFCHYLCQTRLILCHNINTICSGPNHLLLLANAVFTCCNIVSNLDGSIKDMSR